MELNDRQQIVFEIDKTKLGPSDANTYEIIVQISDDSNSLAFNAYTFSIVLNYQSIAVPEIVQNAYESEEERLAIELMMQEANEAVIAALLEEAKNQDEEIEILPVILWTEEITSNGIMTIMFNQPLKIPDKVKEL